MDKALSRPSGSLCAQAASRHFQTPQLIVRAPIHVSQAAKSWFNVSQKMLQHALRHRASRPSSACSRRSSPHNNPHLMPAVHHFRYEATWIPDMLCTCQLFEMQFQFRWAMGSIPNQLTLLKSPLQFAAACAALSLTGLAGPCDLNLVSRVTQVPVQPVFFLHAMLDDDANRRPKVSEGSPSD